MGPERERSSTMVWRHYGAATLYACEPSTDPHRLQTIFIGYNTGAGVYYPPTVDSLSLAVKLYCLADLIRLCIQLGDAPYRPPHFSALERCHPGVLYPANYGGCHKF